MQDFFRHTYIFLLLACWSVAAQQPDPLRATDAIAQQQWVDSVYSRLSLPEKIGQLFMPMVFSERDQSHFEGIEKLVEKGLVGGVLYSLGTPEKQIRWTNAFQAKAKVPLLVAMDAEWGVGMRLQTVQDFPWNMTLGAHQSTDITKQIGYRMGLQSKRLGVHLNFAPVADINSNPKNPIIGNRSFGENPNKVADFSVALHQGYAQSGGLTSAKHFPGHGNTYQDSHKTLPTVPIDREQLENNELVPFKRLIEAGVSSIMVAHLNLPKIEEDGLPSTLSYGIVTQLLQEQLGFNGLVVTDALDMKGVSKYKGGSNIDLLAFLAGNDLLLLSEDIPAGVESIAKAYRSGRISENRLARSVKKILKAKYLAGLHQYAPSDEENATTDLNNDTDASWITRAYGAALTLLENDGILPLSKEQAVGHLPLGDDSAKAFSEQLQNFLSVDPLSTDSLQKWSESNPNRPIVVSFHRPNEDPWEPYTFSKEQLKRLRKLQKKHPIILLPFVKPYALANLNFKPAALLWAYQNAPEAQVLAAQALLGLLKVDGRLPVSAGKYKAGAGLDLNKQLFWEQLPAETKGFSLQKLQKIDSIVQEALAQKMTPGMQVLVAKSGDLVWHKAYGYHTYKKKRAVDVKDIYDLASLTKILATLPLLMQAVDREEVDLDDSLGNLLPDFKKSNKADISLREMLSHYARLTPWIPFYKKTLDENGTPLRKWYRKKPSKRFSIPIASEMYLKHKFHDFIRDSIRESPLLKTLSYTYSDLPFYLLQFYFEDTASKSLACLVEEQWIRPLGLKRTGFLPLNWMAKDSIVPSEKDTYFRQMVLQGRVHDMGAALLNGVGGHAGLYSNALEVAKIMQLYLNKGKYTHGRMFSAKTFDEFNSRSFAPAGVRRGIGFDKPQFSDEGPAATAASAQSFGHLGFTGTYAWADPKHQLIVVVLSNRTYPTMDNNNFSKYNIRTRIHQAVYDALIPDAL